MIIREFIAKTKAGLYCIPGDFYLDPKSRVHHAVVSHAHADHAVPNSGTIWCTAPTKSIMNRRYKYALRSEFSIHSYRQPFQINGVEVVFYPAGHMLGSAQILLRYQGESYLYTGDFKVQNDESCEPFEFVKCDYLITETTFAAPQYDHPDPAQTIKDLMLENKNVVIGAYAVGKAQRVTQLLNQYAGKRKVYIHNDLSPFHAVYQEYGFDLGEWQTYRREDFLAETDSFYIVPPSHFMRFSRNKNVIKVFATGWKHSYYKCDRVLPISDHADWNGLLKLVEISKPKKIFTVHGDGRILKQHFDTRGIEVEIID